jgi:putative DNA primase/helicase
MLTRLTGAAPSPGADCSRWMKFLHELTGGDRGLQDYLQRMAGYFLTGSVTEHAIFFLYGKSRTGKTVFLTVMKALLGDYAISAAMDLFIQQEGFRHPTDVMDLKGPRLVVASETQDGARWNDALLKQIAGGDNLRAHRMRQDPEEFAVHCKLALAGNHRPKIRLGDDGMRTRFRVIPCRYRQPVLDKDLVDKLKEELSGIFGWALEGLFKREAGASLGLEDAPAVIREATDEYFEAQDTIKRFVEAGCDRSPEYWVSTEDLYKTFKTWCERVGERWLPMNKFAEKLGLLDELGIERSRHPKTEKRGFRGLRLTQAHQEF